MIERPREKVLKVRDRERKSELKMLVVDGRLEAEFCSVL